MPAGRIILKSISGSKKLSKLKSDGARLLYTWLIPHVDVNGCFSADPIVINGQVLTRLNKSLDTVKGYLDDLEIAELIIRYNSNGDDFLFIPDFVEKQPQLRPDREGKTSIPLPTPDQLQSKSRPTPAEVKLSKVKLSKYREQVWMTEEQYNKLIETHGETAVSLFLDKLNNYKETTGKKYKSDYHAILNWVVNAVLGDDKGSKGGTPIKCKECGVTGVYINDEGYCAVCESKSTRGSKK